MYVLAYLKTGPESGKQTPEQSKEIFAGHMANIHRLADEGKLCIAGPFGKPKDPSWRGIFVMDVRDMATAETLVASDPGVQARVFSTELFPMRASSALRQTIQIEQRLLAERAQRQAADKPPPSVRGYVMVTASNGAQAQRALAGCPLRVIWSGRLEAPRAGVGVFVLDAETPEAVHAALGASEKQLGECSIDAWYSSVSVQELPPDAGRFTVD